jgi:hypothetical protein
MIRQHLHDSRWEEPILLALGFVGLDYPEDAAELVETAILAANEEAQELGFTPSRHEEILGRDYLFALRCLGDLIPVHVQSLDRLMHRLATELTGQSPLIRFQRYIEVIGKRSDQLSDSPAGIVLVKYLTAALTHEDWGVRIMAVEVLVQLRQSSPEVVAALTAALTHEDWDLRIRAADSLWRLGDRSPEVVSALTAALTHEDRDIRMIAADTLGQLRYEPQTVVSLCAIWQQSMSDSDSWEIRRNATRWLAQHASNIHELLPLFRQALLDEHNDVRSAAAAGLAQFARRYPSHAAEIEDLLLTAIQDPAFEAEDRNYARTGQNYAYDGLWQLLVSETDEEDE